MENDFLGKDLDLSFCTYHVLIGEEMGITQVIHFDSNMPLRTNISWDEKYIPKTSHFQKFQVLTLLQVDKMTKMWLYLQMGSLYFDFLLKHKLD